jgi:hypothetical protein
MVFLRDAVTIVAGLAITKAIVNRTTDEPNAPNVVPVLPDKTTTPIRPLIITDRPTEGAIERGKKGFGL